MAEGVASEILVIGFDANTRRKKIVIEAPYFAVVGLSARCELSFTPEGGGVKVRRGDEFGSVESSTPISEIYLTGKAGGEIRLLVSNCLRVRVSAVDAGTAPASASVTPSGNDLAQMAAGLYVGGAGDVTIIDPEGNTVTYPAVPAGTTLPCDARRVTAATTASNIVAYLIS